MSSKFCASLLLALGLSACVSLNDTMSDTAPDNALNVANGAQVAVGETPNVSTGQTLPLPEFPNYPAPQATLYDGQDGVIYFQSRSPYDFSVVLNDYDSAVPTTGMGTLVLPEGAGANSPVPAMIILHGSGGISDGREHEYAKLFADNGIAGFVVDYYAPRGVTADTPYVMKTMAATEIDILADAYAALRVLSTHPAIDKTCIGVTGYSYGGMATRYLLDARVKDIMGPDLSPFALHVDVYGPCHQSLGYKGTTGAPYLALYGDADNSVDPDTCNIVQDAIRYGGSAVEAHMFKGAGHAWEISTPKSEFPNAYIRDCDFSFEPVTGRFLINGEAVLNVEPGMSREQRAFQRTTLGEAARPCIGMGYTIGNDPVTDARAKTIMLDFMIRNFGIK